ncbi:MAG: family ATP-binding protein, partial [Bacilli bacterium]|nr:family ATP-binding protein [Bacilli bacterium]
LDVMLLDLPPGTGDVAMDVHHMLPKSVEIIITTPHPGAAEVAARAGTMAIKTNHEILGVIENMSYFVCSHCAEKHYIFGAGAGRRLAKELGTNLLGEIPLSEATASGRTIYAADSAQGKIFEEIAERTAKELGLTALEKSLTN